MSQYRDSFMCQRKRRIEEGKDENPNTEGKSGFEFLGGREVLVDE